MIVLKRLFQPYIPVVFVFLLVLMSIPSQAEPVQDNVLFTKARDLASEGNFLEAVSVFRDISTSSDDPETRASALLYIGTIYDNDLDQKDAAISCYKDLIHTYPQSSSAQDALFNCGQVYYKTGRYRDAKQMFDDYIQKYPKGMRIQSAMDGSASAGKKISIAPVKIVTTRTLPPMSPTIRVLVARGLSRVTLKSPSKLTITDVRGNILLSSSDDAILTMGGRGLRINSRSVPSPVCRISSDSTGISVNGKRYRGTVTVYAKSSGINIVNHLDIESYLYGVVPREMSCLWSPEALMAQAVASRTYAMYIRDKDDARNRSFDVEASTASQVYGGLDAERKQTKVAVDKTRGTVMTHEGKLIIAYFHSNSGGYTESSLNVWGVDLPYLASVEDAFSTLQQEDIWEYSVSYKTLFSIFRNIKPGLGSIYKIEPGAKTPSGRNETFTLISDTTQVKITGNTFRLALGPNNLKSTIFKIIPGKTGVTFRGTGYGHGVGMSQWGANRMGKTGYRFSDILKHYYKDVTITEITYK
jgi:stage II sporulation protein D